MRSRGREAAALAAALVLGACSADRPLEPQGADLRSAPGAESAPAPDRRTARVEIDYMIFTIDHHASGIAMAELCLEKAFHAELLELCSTSIEMQREEIAQTRAWLRGWYGTDHEPQISSRSQATLDHLAALPDGAPFEDAFLDEFSRHHAQIIAVSTALLPRLQHEALREMARMIIETQTQAIQMMQRWDCEWYDDCRPRAA